MIIIIAVIGRREDDNHPFSLLKVIQGIND